MTFFINYFRRNKLF